MNTQKKFKTLGIIGDIHAEDVLLESAINFLKSQNVEEILCVGDIVDGFGDAEKCCNILLAENIPVVLGNHDRWLLEEQMRDLQEATLLNSLSKSSRSFLSSLPRTYEFLTIDGPALLCHGLGNNDMARLTPDDYGYGIEVNTDLQALIKERKYKYVFNGHTHYRMVRKFDDLTIVNAGTLKQEHNPVFLFVDLIQNFVKFYNFTTYLEIEEGDIVNLS